MKLFENISRSMVDFIGLIVQCLVIALGLVIYSFSEGLGLGIAVGGGMIASGAAALLLTVQGVASRHADRAENAYLTAAKEAGLVGYSLARPELQFDNAKIIQIISVTGQSIFLRYANLAEWIDKCPEAQIQVLLLHPFWPPGSFSFVQQREWEEGQGSVDLTEINDFVKRFTPQASFGRNGRYELRFARRMPSISFFRIDDRIYWAPYLAKKIGPMSPHFEVERGRPLFERLVLHFEEAWKQEENEPLPPLPLEPNFLEQTRLEWRFRSAADNPYSHRREDD